jgi:hypothetical protein
VFLFFRVQLIIIDDGSLQLKVTEWLLDLLVQLRDLLVILQLLRQLIGCIINLFILTALVSLFWSPALRVVIVFLLFLFFRRLFNCCHWASISKK